MKGSLNAGLQPVWYIGAIDLPYAENKNILTVKAWSGIKQFVKVKVNLIPTELTPQQTSIIYASEADVLNQKECLIKLNKIAIHQMFILEEQTTKILK